MTGRELSEALRSGRRVYGTAITSPAPRWIEAVPGIGLDFVFLDTEHIPIDRHQLSWMCHAYRGLGLPPVVRVPSPDPYLASQAYDGGACGVIFPYVETPEEVVQLRGVAKFSPLKGERLASVLAGKETWEPELDAYLAARNADHVMIVNIESRPAMEALDAILAVPGLDAVLIGPHDLSCNLGVPERYDHPVFLDAVSTIIRKARACNVGAGIHFTGEPAPQIAWGREGMNLIIHSTDIAAFTARLQADVRAIREALGDAGSLVPGSQDHPVV